VATTQNCLGTMLALSLSTVHVWGGVERYRTIAYVPYHVGTGQQVMRCAAKMLMCMPTITHDRFDVTSAFNIVDTPCSGIPHSIHDPSRVALSHVLLHDMDDTHKWS